ncbi:hypothetical protein H4582DRAFT_121705 [Lactarius indigo]|nr:hypothetical protein H4582DRAFT_121705 [Lactarius indigo]
MVGSLETVFVQKCVSACAVVIESLHHAISSLPLLVSPFVWASTCTNCSSRSGTLLLMLKKKGTLLQRCRPIHILLLLSSFQHALPLACLHYAVDRRATTRRARQLEVADATRMGVYPRTDTRRRLGHIGPSRRCRAGNTSATVSLVGVGLHHYVWSQNKNLKVSCLSITVSAEFLTSYEHDVVLTLCRVKEREAKEEEKVA